MTSSLAPSGFWLHGSTVPQVSGGNEVVQSGDNQAAWAVGQQKLNSNVDTNSSSHCNSLALVEGIWPSPPPHLNISLKLCPNSTCERELAPKHPLPSPYSPSVTSKPSTNLIQHDQVEKANKPDTSLGCRIFGIDLKNNSSILSSSMETKPCSPNTVSQADAEQVSQPSKEQQQVMTSEPSTKGMQTKHASNLSSRTRTKVQNGSLLQA